MYYLGRLISTQDLGKEFRIRVIPHLLIEYKERDGKIYAKLGPRFDDCPHNYSLEINSPIEFLEFDDNCPDYPKTQPHYVGPSSIIVLQRKKIMSPKDLRIRPLKYFQLGEEVKVRKGTKIIKPIPEEEYVGNIGCVKQDDEIRNALRTGHTETFS